MLPIKTYKVAPSLPEKLKGLGELAHNLMWCWDHDAIALFRRLDHLLWEEVHHNPVLLLGEINQARLLELARDDGFLAQLDRTRGKLNTYLESQTWFDKNFPNLRDTKIAYFSFEFGLTESIPIYSGGLGILAGDHLKSSSDLGLPLVGVGLLYQGGYFRQRLNTDGWQVEDYPTNDFYNLPLAIVTKESVKNRPGESAQSESGPDEDIVIEVKILNRTVAARIWELRLGRIRLFLLDTNIERNTAEDRNITRELYGGDLEMRIKQEILLGIGGMRALAAMGITPEVCHMNEGHSAFLALERIRRLMAESKLSFAEAA